MVFFPLMPYAIPWFICFESVALKVKQFLPMLIFHNLIDNKHTHMHSPSEVLNIWGWMNNAATNGNEQHKIIMVILNHLLLGDGWALTSIKPGTLLHFSFLEKLFLVCVIYLWILKVNIFNCLDLKYFNILDRQDLYL